LVAAANPRHLVLRTSWVISPFGNNFAKTMLRLGAERSKLSVVGDQHGAPTYAPHLAAAILSLAHTMQTAGADDPRWGVYHVTNQGETTWHGLATEVFRCAASHGIASPHIEAIATSDYPTPARRPANSRLDGRKLWSTFGIVLPPWQSGVQACVARLCGKQE
jgi:dTDP-4-dehydrorhamnose reductase